MGKIIDSIIGSLDEKRAYKANEARAKALPAAYHEAYKNIKNYLFNTSGILSMKPLETLVDILEGAAAQHKNVTDVIGKDVAAFANELVKDEPSYQQMQSAKLNSKINKTSEL
jgi:DNA-binding ferritin-like protein (Dps family)